MILSAYHQGQGRDVTLTPIQQCTEDTLALVEETIFYRIVTYKIYEQNSKLTSEGVLKLISSKQPSNSKLNVGSTGKKHFTKPLLFPVILLL